MSGHVARAQTLVTAPPDVVWQVLIGPGPHPEIMFGAETVTDWTVGSPIRWRGQWQGNAFEDRGIVLAVEPGRLLRVTHYSPMSGLPDVPESYHTLTYRLSGEGDGTRVTLEQDNNPTVEAAEHSAANWSTMLEGIKAVAERAHGAADADGTD